MYVYLGLCLIAWFGPGLGLPRDVETQAFKLRRGFLTFLGPLNFHNSSHPTPVWISLLFAVFVTTFGQIWYQPILPRFSVWFSNCLCYKSDAFTVVFDATIIKPMLLQLYFQNIWKYKSFISTVWNETISKTPKVFFFCKKNNTKPMVLEHPL